MPQGSSLEKEDAEPRLTSHQARPPQHECCRQCHLHTLLLLLFLPCTPSRRPETGMPHRGPTDTLVPAGSLLPPRHRVSASAPAPPSPPPSLPARAPPHVSAATSPSPAAVTMETGRYQPPPAPPPPWPRDLPAGPPFSHPASLTTALGRERTAGVVPNPYSPPARAHRSSEQQGDCGGAVRG